MSDIKIKCITDDLKMTAKATFLPTGYIKPTGTLTTDKLGLVDVTPYEKVNIKSATKVNIHYGLDEPTDTSKLWVKKDFEPSKLIINSNNSNINDLLTEIEYGSFQPILYGNKIYLFGGKTKDGSYDSTKTKIFDIETKTVSTINVYYNAHYGRAIAKVGNKVYLFGGYGGTSYNTISKFDLETETMTTLEATCYQKIYDATAVAVGTKIYIFGGYASGVTEFITVFDTETEEKCTKLSTSMNVSAKNIAAAAVGTKVYLFGGVTTYAGDKYTNKIQVFDAETETCTTLSATLNVSTSPSGAAAIGNKVYLFGCYSNSFKNDKIQVFDAETETIAMAGTTPPELTSIIAVSVGDKVYLFSKYKVYTYDEKVSLEENILKLESGTSNNFKLFDNTSYDIAIGVTNAYVGNSNNEGEQVKVALHNGTNWVEIN